MKQTIFCKEYNNINQYIEKKGLNNIKNKNNLIILTI